MQLNENTLTILGTFPGGGIYRFVVTNTGTEPLTGIFLEARNTPEKPFFTILDASSDYTNLHGILGYSATDGTLDVMNLKPGVAVSFYVDCSQYTSVRVSATGRSADAEVDVTLPSGFPADIASLLVTSAGAGMVGVSPIAGITSDDVQGALVELTSNVTGAQVTASNAADAAEQAQRAAEGAATAAQAAQSAAEGAGLAVSGAVRWDAAQTLTSEQQAQARQNIGADGTVTKESIGLGNVDNTSDLNKPTSTATQAALDTKEPKITGGASTDYLRGDKSVTNFATAVRGTLLTGLSTATTSAIVAGDTSIVAFGKLQGQMNTRQTTAMRGAPSGYPGLNASYGLLLPDASGTTVSTLINANTAARTYTLPDKDGTVAMISDLPSNTGGGWATLVDVTVTPGTYPLSLDWPTIFADNPQYNDFVLQCDGVTVCNSSTFNFVAVSQNLRVSLDGSSFESGLYYQHTSPGANTQGLTSIGLGTGWSTSFVATFRNVQSVGSGTVGSVERLGALKTYSVHGVYHAAQTAVSTTAAGYAYISMGLFNQNQNSGPVKGVQMFTVANTGYRSGRFRIFGVKP